MKETMCCKICNKQKPMDELVFVAQDTNAVPICKIHPHPKDIEILVEVAPTEE